MGKSPAKALITLSDKHTLELFFSIAIKKSAKSAKLKNRKVISEKAYYSRIRNLISSGLVKRKDGMLTLTIFGQICYHACIQIDSALPKCSKPRKIEKEGTAC